MSPPRIPLAERILRNSRMDESGCRIWTSCLDSDGYGYLHNRQGSPKNLKAHRVSYEQFVGPIPAGMYVCHSCDVRRCVNPEHLWLGTHEQNQNDRILKGRSAKGSQFKTAKLNEKIVKAIRAANGSMREIGAAFGISPQHVHDVRTRKTWKHV